MTKLDDLKRQLITRYKDLGYVYCPALEDKIYFTMRGSKHILGNEKSQKKKTTKEVISRLNLILEIKDYLEKAMNVSEYRKQKGNEYFMFAFHVRHEHVQVVVLKDRQNICRFLSVFIDQ
jgi:hypothetical protein